MRGRETHIFARRRHAHWNVGGGEAHIGMCTDEKRALECAQIRTILAFLGDGAVYVLQVHKICMQVNNFLTCLSDGAVGVMKMPKMLLTGCQRATEGSGYLVFEKPQHEKRSYAQSYAE